MQSPPKEMYDIRSVSHLVEKLNITPAEFINTLDNKKSEKILRKHNIAAQSEDLDSVEADSVEEIYDENLYEYIKLFFDNKEELYEEYFDNIEGAYTIIPHEDNNHRIAKLE